jgi:kynurenine 3-monooxygenase
LKRIAVVGAGPAGAYVAGSLAERGFEVLLVDKMENPAEHGREGQTIQLSLSPRGLRALDAIGLREATVMRSIELVGRAFHAPEGDVRLFALAHGAPRNRSISRAILTRTVLDWALAKPGITARFGTRCLEVLRAERSVVLQNPDGTVSTEVVDAVIGTDGAASEVRAELVREPSIDFGKRASPWGYLDRTIADVGGEPPLGPPAMHIWPRGSFFMVGLPASDGSYRCTIVMRHEDHEALHLSGKLEKTLDDAFPDLVAKFVPNGHLDRTKLSPIPIVRCGSWHDDGFLAILGDAAHATAPFLGQGVNIALEDAAALVRAFDTGGADFTSVFEAFAEARVPEGLACCDLSEHAAPTLLEMPAANPGPSALQMLNVEGRSYVDVARTFIPGWEGRVYADAVPVSEEGVASLSMDLHDPFSAAAGELLMAEGDEADALLHITSGTVRVFGEKLGEVRLKAPVVVGEVGFFGAARRTASVMTETPCAGGRVTYARLEALCLTDPARALDIVRSMASLSVERMKEHFHPRASYVVIVASAAMRMELEAWCLSCREHLASYPIACTAEVAPILVGDINLQPTRVIPALSVEGTSHLASLLDSARVLLWIREDPLPEELVRIAEARNLPVLRTLDAAKRYFETQRRREADLVSGT